MSNTKFGPGGPKFDTDSRVLKPKATGLHLVGVRGHTRTSTLALPASWAEVGGSNGGPSNFEFYTMSNTKFGPGGPKFDTDSRVLKPKATGLHLVGVRGHTRTSTLALPASWAEVGGSNGGPSNFEFYTMSNTKFGPGVPSLTRILGS